MSVFANVFKIKNAQKTLKNDLASSATKISDSSNCRCKEIMHVFLLGFFRCWRLPGFTKTFSGITPGACRSGYTLKKTNR